MSVYQLLQMLPECRETGRGLEELLEEIGADVAWVRCEYRRQARKPSTEDQSEEGYRIRCGIEYRSWQKWNWLEWRNKTNLTSLHKIYKMYYNDQTIADMVTRENPTSFFATMRRESDAALERLAIDLAKALFDKPEPDKQ